MPVADLSKSTAFYEALGFLPNPQFTGETASCIVISDTIHLMLLPHATFTRFTPKQICDTKTSTQVLLTLTCASREEVDGLVAKALEAGGSVQDEAQDHGFMYDHGFSDPDGHGWGLVYMYGSPPQ
jgi:predicted lactoylglutathione lyase